jgi:hypothetical protein
LAIFNGFFPGKGTNGGIQTAEEAVAVAMGNP